MNTARVLFPACQLAGLFFPPDWTVVDDVQVFEGINLDRIEVVPVLTEKERMLGGVEFLARTEKMEAGFSLCAAKVMMESQDWLNRHRGKNIYFTRTLIHDPREAIIKMAFLAFNEQRDRWVVRFQPVKAGSPRRDEIFVMVSIHYQGDCVPKLSAN